MNTIYQNCTVNSLEKNTINVNGQIIEVPNDKNGNINSITIINNKVYVNGQEYVNGEWKKTFKAWWHKYF